MEMISQKDPILSWKIIDNAAGVWHGEWPVSDAQLSPILADLSALQRANIKVDGMTADYDVLAPDTILFRERLVEYRVSGDWLHWEKQMHCFPILFPYHVHEGVVGKDWILEVLASNAQHLPT
jgi:acetyl esterase/lipase